MVDVRDEVEHCSANTKKLFCVPRITPELSRPAERDRRWLNHSASAETAKRARLEQIVRAHQPSFCQEPSQIGCHANDVPHARRRVRGARWRERDCVRTANPCSVRVCRRLTRPVRNLLEHVGGRPERSAAFNTEKRSGAWALPRTLGSLPCSAVSWLRSNA